MLVLPPRELVHRLLRYDVETGHLIWLPRPREMFLTNGQFLNWNKRYPGTEAGNIRKGSGYRYITINGDTYAAHRLVWLSVKGLPVPERMDHQDHNKANNRIRNLRAATASQNRANIPANRDNLLGIKGVKCIPSGRYVARFQQRHLGTFDTAAEAAAAYRKAAVELFGEFANW